LQQVAYVLFHMGAAT